MDMAAECRDLASVAKSDAVREQLLEIAEQFQRLAANVGKRPRNGQKVPS
jgi:hypothetical protein